jgi:hypothetical protein
MELIKTEQQTQYQLSCPMHLRGQEDEDKLLMTNKVSVGYTPRQLSHM